MDLGQWSDVSAWLITAVNHVLDYLDFKKNNTKSRKHFLIQIRLAIQLKII